MFNPFQTIQQMQNPNQLILNQLQKQNPKLYQKVQEMTNGKTETELREMVQNIASERGVNLSQFANQFGIKI